MIPVPTSVEPVNTILRTSGCVTNRSPTTEPLPGRTVNTPSGRPASRASSPSRIAVSGVSSAGLRTTVLPAASAGAKPPAGDRHREVPRHDDADDAERLLEGDVDAAGDRDLPAEQPLGRGGVVVEHVADVAGLPAGVADGVPGVAHLERGELLDGAVDRRGEPAQQPAPVGGRDLPPRARTRRAPGRWRRRSPRPTASATVVTCSSVAGSMTSWVRTSLGHRHILSNPRKRSQSVTAASNAASSTSALLT